MDKHLTRWTAKGIKSLEYAPLQDIADLAPARKPIGAVLMEHRSGGE